MVSKRFHSPISACRVWVGGDQFLPSSTSNLGQSELDTPDFTLVAQTIFTDNLQLGVARGRKKEKMLDRGSLRHKQRKIKLMLSGQEIRTDEPIRMLLDKVVSTKIIHGIFCVLQFVCAQGAATTTCEGSEFTYVDEGHCRSWNRIVAP